MALPPANTPNLTLGRALFDKRQFRPDTDPAVVETLERIILAMKGAGWPSAAKKGDEVYMQVYAQLTGDEHTLYGGNPADPLNPTTLIVSAAASNNIEWQEEGVTVATRPKANFIGDDVTVTDDAGNNRVNVTIVSGGGGTVTESFKTIAVSGQSDVVADAPADTLTLVAGSNVTITTNAGTDTITIASAVDGVGYDEIQEEGTPLTKRANLNFISERVTATDNAGSSRTDVTFEYFIRVYGTTTTAVTAATTAFDVDGVSVIQGDMPELTAGELEITNAAKIPIDDETEAEFRWNEDAGQWQTEPLKCHMVTGLATAAVTGAAFSIDNIEMVCGSDPRSDPSSAAEALSVENPFAWDIDNNGTVLATKKANGDWIAIQAACPA